MTDIEWLTEPYRPVEIEPILLAFPASVQHLMPSPEGIPDRFWRSRQVQRNPWTDLFDQWFFRELSEEVEFHAAEGLDAKIAFHHLLAVMRSYQPKHEHKEAAVAYLASLWFSKVVDGEKVWSDDDLTDLRPDRRNEP